MKTNAKLALVIAALGCSLSMLKAEDAPKPPANPDARPAPAEGRGNGGDAKARLEEFFKKMDTNGDGKISKEEYVAHEKTMAEERFSKIDTNNDGFIDMKEFEEAARKLSEARRSQQGPPSGGFRRPEGEGNRPRPSAADGAGAPGGGRGGFGGGGMGELVRKVNENGSVTKEEFQKMTAEQFDKLDTNKDGKITKEELEAAFAKMREAFGNRGQGGPEGGPRRRPEADSNKPKDGS